MKKSFYVPGRPCKRSRGSYPLLPAKPIPSREPESVNIKNIIFFACIVCTLGTSAFAIEHCFEQAGSVYGINPLLLYSIAKIESNFNPCAMNKNKDGSYDYGIMQINTRWYRHLGQAGWANLIDPCYNIHVGAWILRQCIDRHGYTWDAVGCYNASSKRKRNAYAWKIYNALKRTGHTNVKYTKHPGKPTASTVR